MRWARQRVRRLTRQGILHRTTILWTLVTTVLWTLVTAILWTSKSRNHPSTKLLQSQGHLIMAASTDNSRAIWTKRKLSTSRCCSIPDLYSEILLSSLLQQPRQEMIKPLGTVDAGEGGDVQGIAVRHLIPVALLPAQGAGGLGSRAQTSLVTTQLITSLQIPPAGSWQSIWVESCHRIYHGGVLYTTTGHWVRLASTHGTVNPILQEVIVSAVRCIAVLAKLPHGAP